ncbi:SDR family NAD(P)-dependent oxidoreductase [Paraflavitalea soli]|uniref:SDR family NAD(P)-dependent oxidoreductase n=1 Tax=Paraflavitalea soli TaxID=2315862 RepID=A0A3B7MSC4_9BACT|nr:SDR family NAD(P)-dependent oxidoreductase [Paraflavitalea soli]AXY74525.1 SDR family NAD(P)-dependent oxidoreductase [Paraflavitalea soli]
MKKIIFITGTSTGFGKLMTITLSKAGHTVIAGMRGTTGKNAAVAAELAALPHVFVEEIDITSDDSVNQAISNTLAKHGRIDVLVNNAAVAGFGLLEGYSIDQVKNMLDVNLLSVLRTYQAVLPSMRAARNGLVINLTSGASGFTVPFMVPYLMSKFGVETITEGLQMELEQFGIENVTIQPGVYPTEMNNGSKPGINADRQDIVTAYGDIAAKQFEGMGQMLFGKMEEFKMDPQVIADGVLALVNMEKGTRPLRYPLDAVAQGADHEFVEARASIKAKWAANYGFISQ